MKRILLAALIACGSLAALAAPVPKDKEAALPPPTEKQLETSKNNLKQIGIAVITFSDADKNGHMPCNSTDKDGNFLLSWRVQILPYLEEGALFNQFKLDEPWNSKTNKPLVEKIPKVYAPIRVKAKKGETYYRGFNGSDTAFDVGKLVFFPRSFADGTSNTILAVEAAEPCVWSKPDDLPYDAMKPLPKLGGLFNGDFHVVFADGTVKTGSSKKMDADEFRLLLTMSDGQNMNAEKALGIDVKK